MKSIKVIIKTLKNKETGKEFTICEIGGKYLPIVTADLEATYKVKFVGNEIKMPTKDGIYAIAYEDKGLWIDSRTEYVEKHIVRIIPKRILLDKAL